GQRGRCLEDHRLDEFHDVRPERDVLRIGVRVALREPRQLPMVAVRVVPEEDRIPVGEGQEELRVERMDFVPETREIEVADDLGPQESRGVGESGESDPGEHLFGDGRAADDPSTFEDEHLEPGLREIGRGDGGYLLELEKRGYVQAGPFTPEVVLEHPAAVKELHQEFLDAGAEVLQSVAFYASKEKLATTGFADRVGEINRAAVRLAREVAGSRALVAANLSLTWMYDPKVQASTDKVRGLFDEQLAAQLRESPDFVIAETFSWLAEALLAAERIEKTGLPSMVTMSFDKNPVSYDGHSPSECARALHDAGVDIVGANCLRNPML